MKKKKISPKTILKKLHTLQGFDHNKSLFKKVFYSKFRSSNMSQEIKDNELQSVIEEEEGEDTSQAGSELEIDKKKEAKPLKSAL